VARPADGEWRPLGLDRDPVPGDPSRISEEAQHLASVATEITSQVAALRKIAASGDEVGQHADEIRSSAKDLADQLDKVAGRYQKVSSALNGWIPDLERAQAMSVQALDQAEGPYKQVNQSVVLPSGPNLTTQQQQAVQQYHDSVRKAQGDLAAAQALLHRATALRDSSGSHYAGLIRQACDDGVKDSWWDSFKDWVSSFSKVLKTICTVLEIIATILAIAAFIIAQFIPGLDVLVDALVLAAIITTAVAASGRLLLAATGNGSWLDFAIDAFSLATFGVGRLAGSVAKGLEATTMATSKAGLTAELADAVMQESPRGMMVIKYAQMQGVSALEMADRLGKFGPSLANDAKLTGAMKVMASLGAFGEEGDTYAKLLTLGGRFTNGFTDLSNVTAVTKGLLTISGGSTGIAGLAGAAAPVLGGFEIDGLSGQPVVSWQMPGVSDWWEHHLADPMTAAIPTGAANVVADVTTVTAPVVGLPLQAYRLTHGG
jgi:hypothetical protein